MFAMQAPVNVAAGMRRAAFGFAAGLLLALAGPTPGRAAESYPLNVVASFSILGDMVREVGGDRIALTVLVGPDGDMHSFEPVPENARAMSKAALLVVNGLDFEGWLARLVKASAFNGTMAVASEGVAPRRHDPHAWQSLANGVVYVRNIASALARADPAHRAEYDMRAAAYIEKIKTLDVQLEHEFAAIPASRRKVVTSHDAFGYFGQRYGVQFISVAGLSSDAEPSAKEVARIIDQVRRQRVPAVFIENITSDKLVNQIAHETGAQVGGTLYSDALAQPGQPADTYLGMFQWNARQLLAALRAPGTHP